MFKTHTNVYGSLVVKVKRIDKNTKCYPKMAGTNKAIEECKNKARYLVQAESQLMTDQYGSTTEPIELGKVSKTWSPIRVCEHHAKQLITSQYGIPETQLDFRVKTAKARRIKH